MGEWARQNLSAGAARVGDLADMALEASAYVFGGYLVDPTAPLDPVTPVTTSRCALGVNVISNGGAAERFGQAGCRYFVVIDDFAGASLLKRKYSDATVMARRWFGGEIPSIERAYDRLNGADDPGLIYVGLNEADGLGQDGDALRRRADFDVKLAERIRSRSGARYAAGSFSMGSPDFTNEETCRIIRQAYAPAYNAGVIGLDMHLYSPALSHIDNDAELIWFERRWEFLFTHCGFDPRLRAIYCSETGLDEAAVGGFPAHHATQDQFRAWCARFIEIQNGPIVVNGTARPSPVCGAAIFQAGDSRTGSGGWGGYNIEDYLGSFASSGVDRAAG